MNFLQRTAVAATALLALASAEVAENPPPAEAGVGCTYTFTCGSIRHLDRGVDGPFQVQCSSPVWEVWVYKGQTSKTLCTDADSIWVGRNRELWCVIKGADGFIGTYKEADARGEHSLGWGGKSCYWKTD